MSNRSTPQLPPHPDGLIVQLSASNAKGIAKAKMLQRGRDTIQRKNEFFEGTRDQKTNYRQGAQLTEKVHKKAMKTKFFYSP